jgi:hypothetical protein
MARHGFDITDFGDEFCWQRLCHELGLKFKGKGKVRPGSDGVEGFFWYTSGGLTVITQNNPETGEYAPGSDRRSNQKGFASYIGLEGPDYEVANCAARIRSYAASIKDESAGSRDFI